MPYTIVMEPSFLQIVLHGVVTRQDMHALADDLMAIEAGRMVMPHRLNDFSAMTEPFLTPTAAPQRPAHMLTVVCRDAQKPAQRVEESR